MPDTDVLVTVSPGVTLAIMVADCVPLALVDPDAGVLAAVHAGWRGTAAGAVERRSAPCRTAAQKPDGSTPSSGRPCTGTATRSPTRCARRSPTRCDPAALHPAVARPDGPGHWLVDLVAANRQQLLAGGVRDDHIVECGVTTADDAFFSDRAQRPCGRFALLARLSG